MEEFLNVIDRNEEPLKRRIDLKINGKLDAVESLSLPWAKMSKIAIPKPTYRQLSDPVEPLVLPAFRKGEGGPKMSKEMLNALVSGNLLASLRVQEAKIEGAPTWAKISYPVHELNYRPAPMSNNEARESARAREEDILIHQADMAPELCRLMSDDQISNAVAYYFHRERITQRRDGEDAESAIWL